MARDGDLSEDQKALITHFYISALAGMVESWLLGELPYSPEDLVAAMERILTDHQAGAALRKRPS